MKQGNGEAKQLMFLNESGVNLYSGDRTHGWSKKRGSNASQIINTEARKL